MPPEEQTTTCPRCSTTGSGRYCTECGSPLAGAPCRSCGEALTPGSKFCHACGATAGAPVQSRGATLGSTLPWAVAGLAFLALFAMLAGRGFNAKRGSAVDGSANSLPNPALDAGATADASGAADPNAMAAPFAAGAGVRAPDISKMTPQQLAEKLFNRIMTLSQQGKNDSVEFFAPMAIQAYQMVEQQQGHPMDADQRFDVGRIAEVAGALPMAKAQADTILQKQPDHLLGLLLAAQVAKGSGSPEAYKEYSGHFAKVKGSELAKDLPEYKLHRREIDAGV